MRKQSNWDRYCRRERLRDCFTGINFSKLRQAPPNDPEDEEEEDPEEEEQDDDGTLPPIVEQTIAALDDRQSAFVAAGRGGFSFA